MQTDRHGPAQKKALTPLPFPVGQRTIYLYIISQIRSIPHVKPF